MAEATERLLEKRVVSLRKQNARETRSAMKDIAKLTEDTDYLCTLEAMHVAHACRDLEAANMQRAAQLLERRDAEENMTRRVLSLEHEASLWALQSLASESGNLATALRLGTPLPDGLEGIPDRGLGAVIGSADAKMRGIEAELWKMRYAGPPSGNGMPLRCKVCTMPMPCSRHGFASTLKRCPVCTLPAPCPKHGAGFEAPLSKS
jgi:hypothetical protein